MVLFLINLLRIDWLEFVQGLGPVVIGLAAIGFSAYQLNQNLKARRQEEQRKEIYKKLNEFYGPMIQLRKKSRLLYKKFNTHYKQKDPKFSTLRYLINGHEFEGNEKTLLDEIIKIGEKCESLIHDKAGLIDNEKLRNELLPRATTHYLLIRLAFKGALASRAEDFADLSFPKELDPELERRKKELENKLDQLNA